LIFFVVIIHTNALPTKGIGVLVKPCDANGSAKGNSSKRFTLVERK
jgi:hypothetical protein